MGKIGNLANGVSDLANGDTPFLGVAHNLTTKGNTYDEIKLSRDNFNTFKAIVFMKDMYGIIRDEDDVYNDLLISEKLSFYSSHIKTGILKSKLDTLITNLTSGWELVNQKGEVVTKEEYIDDLTFKLTDDFKYDLAQNVITQNEFLIYLDENLNLSIIKSYYYFKKEDNLYLIYYDGEFINELIHSETEIIHNKYIHNDVEYIKKETEIIKISNTKYYIVDNTFNLVGESVSEISLMHSELWTSMQKEILVSPTNLTVDKRLAQNGVINVYQNAHIGIVKPESFDITNTQQSDIEYTQMQMRSTEYKDMDEIISKQLDNLILAEQTDLGLDPTATAVVLNTNEIAKKVNQIKRLFAEQLNIFISKVDNNLFVQIDDFIIEDKELQDKIDSDEITNGLTTRFLVLQKRNTNMSEEELNKMYLTIEIKLGNELTEEEQNQAIQLGLLVGNSLENDFTEEQVNEEPTNG